MMKFVSSLVVVEDVTRSRFLYETILGQTVSADFGENVAFEGGFSLHERSHFRRLIDDRKIVSGSNAFELYFEEDDVDAVETKLRNEGFELIHPTREQPWRQRVLRFYDYDGNIVEIGESLEHVAWRLSLEKKTAAEISRITYLPEKTVEAAIRKYSGKDPV